MTHSALAAALQRLRRRLLAVEVGAGAVWTAIAAIASLLVWTWLDLVLELAPIVRVGSWVFTLLLSAAVVVLIRGAVRRRCETCSLARRLDATAGAGGEILTGVELMAELRTGARGWGDPGGAGALTAGLAEMAMDRAAALASRVSAVEAVPSRPLRRPTGLFALLLIGLVAASLLWPQMARTQGLRFVDPYGDHPPHSHLWFEVQPGTTRVVYGEGLEVCVRPRGGVPERVELVLLASDSVEAEVLPMFPESSGSWRVTLANLTSSRRYYVRAARSRSRRYDIGIQMVPRLEAVRFRVTPPAYSHRASEDGELPPGDLTGLPGTRIEVWAKSNRPLSGGWVDLITPSAGPASTPAGAAGAAVSGPSAGGAATARAASLDRTADPNEVSGVVTLLSSGQLAIRVTDTDGQSSSQAFTVPVTVVADERPAIRMAAPPAESLATPTAVIPLLLTAEDDCGISRVQLFRSLNDSRPLPMDVPLPGVAPTRWSNTVELRLASHGLVPGDEIKLSARVEDNDPDGVKGGESTIATIRIVAQADYEQLVVIQGGLEVMLAKYQQVGRRVESLLAEIEKLRKELEALPYSGDLGEAERARLKLLAGLFREALEAIRKAAKTKLPYDLDHFLDPKLEELAGQLAEAMGELESTAGEPGIGVAQAMEAIRKAAGKCGAGCRTIDTEATEPLEYLVAVYPLIEDEARYVALYGRQREVTTCLAALKDHERETDVATRARMRDLEVEQGRLHDALHGLLSDIEDRVAALPGDERLGKLRETAAAFVEDVRASRVLPAMSEVQAALLDFSGVCAYRAATEAREAMAEFIVRGRGMGQLGRTGLTFRPSLSSGMGSTIEQLLSQAGLSPLGQEGTAAGSGYSVQRSLLQDMGMYGDLSAVASGAQGVSRRGRVVDATQMGGQSSGQSRALPGEIPGMDFSAGGDRVLAVPVQYRRKVGQYFERIAEEMPDRRPALRSR
ncbi:MAG TPA: hypothetical protein PKY77_00780 [Phycisphaerae bacterium]|nr:hypothetical protein [Phycisphaerae bacterium]HRY67611.1 hypothetical protein [Phycisphaerae bacterium]HSA24998.1 hypothetical protein [Phycisphaerae bacterium]